LFSGATLEDICSQCDDISKQSIVLILRLLLAENILIAFSSNQPIPSRIEEGCEVETQWDSTDLSFHSSSRIGYHFGDFGGAFPFVNKIDPRPALKPLPEGERIDLYRPDMDDLIQNDATLSQLQMQRLSVRQYNEKNPISIRQIGEFLYRTARVLFESEIQVTNIKDKSQTTNMELAWRPYPTGGASYELEIYLTVDRAKDLAPGMYYYAPKSHQLIKISEKNQHTDALIDTAYISCAQIVKPQVLLHIASRFQRVSWKYHAIAYATNLRNTGVLYQTFYLNAVAMGLAPCGLGSGNTKEFAAATGNNPLVEGNIGEFMLGSVPEGFDFKKITQEYLMQHHGAVYAETE
jgi:SagB-type dehydrogenase family enzyme